MDEAFNEQIGNYLKEIPKDPKGDFYCYAAVDGSYTLSAKLEDCNDPQAQDCNYIITSEDMVNVADVPPVGLTPPNSAPAQGCGVCNAPTPDCGQTTTGTDNCGTACIKIGSTCPSPPPFTQFDDPGSLPPSSQNPDSGACAWNGVMNVLAYAYADPQYEANRWPEYGWSQVASPGACLNDFEIKGTQSCNRDSDCNDGNSCTTDRCSGVEVNGEIVTNCTYTARTDGGCDRAGMRVDTSRSCLVNSDCNVNACIGGTCVGSDPSEGLYGTCYSKNNPGTLCGTDSGRNKYCDFAGECRSDLCVSNNDCSASNVCTINGACTTIASMYGVDREGNDGMYPVYGVCGKTVKANYSVCEQSGSTISKLCGGGNQVNNTESTCTVDYVTCSDPTKTPATSGGACCGTTNVQGKLCQGECKLRPYPTYYDPATMPPGTPLFDGQGIKNAVIRITGDGCGLSFINKTDSNGMVSFTIPWRVTSGRVHYTISADIPSGIQFTRGVCYNGKSHENPLGLVTQSAANSSAECGISFNGSNTVGFTSTFGFRPSAGAVQGIHSEPASILQTVVLNIFNFIFGK